jgi:hypothetical protein
VRKDADKYFGEWKAGDVETNEYAKSADRDGRRVCFVPRDGAAQSVIRVTYPVELQQGAPDAITADIMNRILGGGGFSNYLFQNLREDKGYTYGAGSSLNPNKWGGTFTASSSVRNEVTDSAITEFLYEMNRIRTEPVEAELLQSIKNGRMGAFARSMESPQTVANRVLSIARFNLPADYYETYLGKVNAITPDDIMRVAQKYIQPDNANIIVVGSKDEAEKLAQFASTGVEYFDTYGNPKDMNAMEMPAGLTGIDVVNRYLDAVGGVEKLTAISDMTMKMQMEGGPVEMMMSKKAPGKMRMDVSMQGMTLAKKVVNDGKGFNEEQGQKTILDEAMIGEMVFDLHVIPQLAYESMNCEMKLESIEEVDGAQAYKVVVTHPDGISVTEYYNVENGLKVKDIMIDVASGQPASSVYSDYKEVDGILIPHALKISPPGAPMSLNFKATEITINSDVSDDFFSVD